MNTKALEFLQECKKRQLRATWASLQLKEVGLAVGFLAYSFWSRAILWQLLAKWGGKKTSLSSPLKENVSDAGLHPACFGFIFIAGHGMSRSAISWQDVSFLKDVDLTRPWNEANTIPVSEWLECEPSEGAADRLRAMGNIVVPLQAQKASRILSEVRTVLEGWVFQDFSVYVFKKLIFLTVSLESLFRVKVFGLQHQFEISYEFLTVVAWLLLGCLFQFQRRPHTNPLPCTSHFAGLDCNDASAHTSDLILFNCCMMCSSPIPRWTDPYCSFMVATRPGFFASLDFRCHCNREFSTSPTYSTAVLPCLDHTSSDSFSNFCWGSKNNAAGCNEKGLLFRPHSIAETQKPHESVSFFMCFDSIQ